MKLHQIIDFIDDNLLKAREQRVSLIKKLTENDKINKICLFGAGTIGQYLYYYFKNEGIKIDCFSDNNIKIHERVIVDNCKCVAPLELKEDYFVIITSSYVNEIYNQLVNNGIKNIIKHPHDIFWIFNKSLFNIDKEFLKEKIAQAYNILEDEKSKKIFSERIKALMCDIEDSNFTDYSFICDKNQYFPNDIKFNYRYFIDCGAFDGDTLRDYLKDDMRKEFLEKYVCYELNEYNTNKIREYNNQLDISFNNKIEIYNLAVSNKNEIIHCSIDEQQGSLIDEDGDNEVLAVSLDNHLQNQKVTFIKMDIEGAELSGLVGSKNIIKNQKPDLAICIYHKLEDLWEIPLYIKSLVPEYKIYIRHYTNTLLETVCYATIKKD